MNNRERVRAIMHYEDYDRMPVVQFGYWYETLDKWLAEGHITEEERYNFCEGNAVDTAKEKADYITDHVDADGVAKALRHFGLIN